MLKRGGDRKKNGGSDAKMLWKKVKREKMTIDDVGKRAGIKEWREFFDGRMIIIRALQCNSGKICRIFKWNSLVSDENRELSNG